MRISHPLTIISFTLTLGLTGCLLGVQVGCDNDLDQDGFIDTNAECNDPGIPSDDCNDEDATIYPGADEACDGVDNNCDDVVDEDCLPTT